MKSYKTSLTIFLHLSYANYLFFFAYIVVYALTTWIAFTLLAFLVYLIGFLGLIFCSVMVVIGVLQTIVDVKQTIRPVIHLLIHIFLLSLFTFNCYFPEWYPYLNFACNYDKRMRVVHLYQEGKLQAVPERPDTFNLPLDDQYLAEDGRISLEDGDVAFYLFVGLVDNYTAYVYSPGHTTLGEYWQLRCNVEKLDASWYYVTCN